MQGRRDPWCAVALLLALCVQAVAHTAHRVQPVQAPAASAVNNDRKGSLPAAESALERELRVLKSELKSLSSLHSIKAATSGKANVFEFMAKSSALMHKVAHGEYQNDAERLLNARKTKKEHSQLRTVDCDQAKGDYDKMFMPPFCALGDNDDNTNQRRRLDSRMIAGPGVHQISPKPHGKTANLHHGAGRRDGGGPSGGGDSGPVFADLAVAGDADGTCISEADLIADNTAGGNGPVWGQLPSQYTEDGCVDEFEFNAIMQDGLEAPSLDAMCSECGAKMMQAISMFAPEEEGGAKAVQAQLKSKCYKKGDTYCGNFIDGVDGVVSWDDLMKDCGAPEDPFGPLPPGTWCSTACKPTMMGTASGWGCCAMTMAIAHGVEFSEYIRRQAASCGATFADVCSGGDPVKFDLQVPNLKYEWVAVPANKAKMENLVAGDVAAYFGVIKSEITVTATSMDSPEPGTIITLNMEFISTAMSEEIRAKLVALAESTGNRRVGDATLAVIALGALPPSAKKDPLADMTTTANGVATGEVVKAKASLFTIPTQAAATFCADTSAVDACKLESRTAAGIAADSCFRVAGIYASGLPECSAVKAKGDVTVACKTALGGDSACFGPALPAPAPSPAPTAITEATHIVKMAVKLPYTVSEFDASKQAKFKQSIANAAGISASDVTIDKISAISTSRRRLLAESIRVDTSVKAKDKSSAEAMGTKLTADNINAELKKAGLPEAEVLEKPSVVATSSSSAIASRGSFMTSLMAAVGALLVTSF